jgi:plasmid maintenance system killer protein
VVLLNSRKSCHRYDMDFDKVVARSLDVIEESEVEEVIKALNDIFADEILDQDMKRLASDS